MSSQHDIGIDLLMDVGRPSKNGTPSSSRGFVPEGQAPFGNILDAQMMPASVGEPLAGPYGDSESVSGSGGDSSTAAVPNGPKLSVLPASPNASADEPSLSLASQPATGVAGAADPDVAAFNNDILEQLPTAVQPSRQAVYMPLDSLLDNFPTGQYNVTGSKLVDGELSLTLSDPTGQSEPVQVRIPSELLTSGLENQTESMTNGRVDLGVMPPKSSDLTRLLAQLNVRQLEISQSATENAEASNPVEITLIGGDGGRRLSLRITNSPDRLVSAESGGYQASAGDELVAKDSVSDKAIPTRASLTDSGKPAVQQSSARLTGAAQLPEVRVFTEPHPTSTHAAQQNPDHDPRLAVGRLNTPLALGQAGGPLPPSAPFPGKPDGNLRTAGAEDFNGTSQCTKFENFALKPASFEDNQQSGDALTSMNSWAASQRLERRDTSSQTIRFSLPDNIQTKLMPNGQSVSIRIEPDHLGPARLSLTISHDKLRARVTVESAHAKALVERSLDRLVHQLTKAGVEVDRIEVAVDGRQSGNELLQRQAQWRRPTVSSMPGPDIETEFNPPYPTPWAATVASYVGAGGVNVLA